MKNITIKRTIGYLLIILLWSLHNALVCTQIDHSGLFILYTAYWFFATCVLIGLYFVIQYLIE